MSASAQSIAYLISRYPAFSHTFIEREIEELRSQGFSIEIASINEPDQIADTSAVYYVKRQGFLKALLALISALIFHPINFVKTLFFVFKLSSFDLKALLYHFFYFGEAALVGQWMNQKKINHLHVHFANPASTVALLVSKLYACTFSITIHGPDEFYDVSVSHLRVKFQEALFICCIGNYARSQVMRLTDLGQWSKIHITPMGVDPEKFKPVTFIENPSPLKLICVGRLTSNKGQKVLLEAISALNKVNIPIQLHLVGDGPDRKTLEELSEKLQLTSRVVFTGSLAQDAVYALLAQSHIFVLASFAEGIPVSLMEAMAMEIPCVATYINGIPELITNEKDGILVFPSDVKSLADEIRRLYENKTLRHSLGLQARKTIQSKWTLKRNVLLLSEVLKHYQV